MDIVANMVQITKITTNYSWVISQKVDKQTVFKIIQYEAQHCKVIIRIHVMSIFCYHANRIHMILFISSLINSP
jgi:hypothetical protein